MKTKFSIIIFIHFMLLLISCDVAIGDWPLSPTEAYFESTKKFTVYFSGHTDNIDDVYMCVKKTGTKKKFYYDLSYDLSLPDSLKNKMTVKAEKSHFSLEDDGLEVTLYFEQSNYGTESVVVQKK